jgi:hypothetical protein
MPDAMIATTSESPAVPDRELTLIQVRAELRDNHPRLTDTQIDLIADVACELRLTQIRLGMVAAPQMPAPAPMRTRVPALVDEGWESQVSA